MFFCYNKSVGVIMINLDLSYVIANILFHMKQLNMEDLNQICLNLEKKGYIVNNSYENVYYVSNEWKDFFRFEKDVLTLVSKDELFKIIFIDVLSDDVKKDIFNSMLCCNKDKNYIKLLK